MAESEFNKETEKWKRIPDFPNYEISNHGNVRRIIKMLPNKNGYHRAHLSANGKRGKSVFVHKLVMELFVGPRPEKHQVNHKDGNKQNNRLDNLEYVTPRQNMLHSWETLRRRGSAINTSKLTEAQIPTIRALAAHGVSTRKIAKQFGVARGSIRAVLDGRSWRHIPTS